MARKRTTRRTKGEGSPWFDKKNNRYVWTIEHKGQRYRVTHQDETQARLQFEQLKRKLFSGIDVAGARTLLQDYLPRWIDSEVAARQNTIDSYHHRADLYIYPSLGDYAIGDIRRPMVVTWINKMMNEPDEGGKYWARSSIKQALSLLRRALESAVPQYLDHNPAAGVLVPKQRKGAEFLIDAAPKQSKIFTPEQLALFLEEVKRTDPLHGLYNYYVFMCEFGTRRGEGLGLRRKDIDFDAKFIRIAQQVTKNARKGTVTIRPKSDAGERELPVSDEMLLLLREQCLRAGAARPNDLVFPTLEGKRRQPDSVTQHFRRTSRRLGFEGYTLHSLRKYAITDWRASGVDLEVAAALAGHTSVKITAETYSQPTMERKREAVKKKATGNE